MYARSHLSPSSLPVSGSFGNTLLTFIHGAANYTFTSTTVQNVTFTNPTHQN